METLIARAVEEIAIDGRSGEGESGREKGNRGRAGVCLVEVGHYRAADRRGIACGVRVYGAGELCFASLLVVSLASLSSFVMLPQWSVFPLVSRG